MSVLLARYEIADLEAFLRVFDGFEATRCNTGPPAIACCARPTARAA